MAFGSKTEVIRVWITPKELREIVNRLEKKMKITVIGEELPREVIHLENNIEVHLILDAN